MSFLNRYLTINRLNSEEVILDYQFTQLLKGFACLMIALHHYSQYILSEGISNSLFYKVFSTQGGYAGVALFFFLSGYGLMESERKQHLSLFQFVIKRFWKIYKAVIIINFLTYGSILCWRYFETGHWNAFNFKLLFSVTKIDYYLWFITKLFCCYLGFSVCSQIKNERSRNIAYGIGQLMVFCYLIIKGEPINHMVSIPLFMVGIYISLFKRQTSLIVHSVWTWISFVFISFSTVLLCYYIHDTLPVHTLFNLFLLVCFLWIISKFGIYLKYKSFLGYISFPVYLIHHKVIMLSSALGHVAPVILFLGLTIYLGWLLQKTLEVSFVKK